MPAGAQQASAVAKDTSEWQVHRSEKFGYEIRYPQGFEAWLTGREGERDGGAIRIGLKEFAAAAPMLDVSVGTRMARGLPPNPPQLNTLERDAVINGVRFREITYRWKANGEIAFVELRHSTALLVFHAPAGTQNLHGTVWSAIMSTFTFVKA